VALSTIPFSGLGADASNQGVNFRNLIINGDMSIAQRGTSSSSITSGGYYTVDRMEHAINYGTWTLSQSTDVPTGQGFAKSAKWDCTATGTPTAGQELKFRQKIEGQFLQYLKKGTSNAESMTLSFWVKSTKTGTYIVEMRDDDNNRNICQSYTISASNTWEKKTLTFDGDTTGAYNNDNGQSLQCTWWLGAGTNFTSGTLATSWESTTNANRAVGQVNLADSTSNEWYITGVQLEVGTSASDFEFLPYDVNLRRCQRYYYIINPNNTYYPTVYDFYAYNDSNCYAGFVFPTPMRTAPSVSMTNNATFLYYSAQTKTIDTSMLYSWQSDGVINYIRFYDGNAFSGQANKSGIFEGGVFKCNAEL